MKSYSYILNALEQISNEMGIMIELQVKYTFYFFYFKKFCSST